jgi:hypothetical protein
MSTTSNNNLSVHNRAARVRRRATPIAVLIFVLAFLWYIGVFGGNVHAVTAGRVYRSAQLTGHNLNDVLLRDHIRTVIDLRGGSTADAWYRSEIASCRQFGVTHIDLPMSARHLPTPDQMRQLLADFDHAPYPILYHCKAGSDRSGLVGAFYLNVYQRVPLNQALQEELTWRYGHFSFGQTHAMDDFFRLYERTSGGASLRDWIVNQYPRIYASLAIR